MRTHPSILWLLALVLLISALVVNAANNPRDSQNTAAVANTNPQVVRLNARSENTKQVSDSVTNLATKIAIVLANSKSKTEIFSPVSIAGALSLLLLGSGGQTQKELLRVMGLDQLPLSFQDIHVSFGRLFQDLVSNDPSLEPLVTWRLNDKCNRYDEDEEDYEEEMAAPPASNTNEYPGHQISVTNGVFLQQGFKPVKQYLTVANDVYKGTVENLDFEREPARSAAIINDWCSKATRGKIREIVTEDILYNSRMIVANALYFKAQWETTFLPFIMRHTPFYPDGKTEPLIRTDSIAISGCFPYYNASAEYGVQILGLPYKKGRSTMYIILPNGSNRQVLREKLATLSAPQLNFMIDKMVLEKGAVWMPKLNISNRIQLSNVLETLGLRDLFDPVRSNLTEMFKDSVNDAPSTVQSSISAQFDKEKQRPVAAKPTIQPERQTTRPSTIQRPQTRPQLYTKTVNQINLTAKPTVQHERPTTKPLTIQPPQTRPQLNTKTANQINLTAKPTVQHERPTTKPSTVQPAQPRPEPNSNTAIQITFILAPQDCQLIENCQSRPDGICSCNAIPTSDNTGCGAYLAGHYYNDDKKHCYYGIEESNRKINICIKPSYVQQHRELQNRTACEQYRGCKMFNNQCYCCNPNMNKNQLSQNSYSTTTNGQYFGVSNQFGGDQENTNNTARPTAKPTSKSNPLDCRTVPHTYCQFNGYEWDPWHQICIDTNACRMGRIKKRQAPTYSLSYQQDGQYPPQSQWQPNRTGQLVRQPELEGSWQQQQQPNPNAAPSQQIQQYPQASQYQQYLLELQRQQKIKLLQQQEQQWQEQERQRLQQKQPILDTKTQLQQSQQYQPLNQNSPKRVQQQQPTMLSQQQGQQRPQQNQQQRPQSQPLSVHVNEIITHVALAVNVQGTEDGEVTAAVIDRISPKFNFRVDIPFLILIREDFTELPLFYGAVYDPRP